VISGHYKKSRKRWDAHGLGIFGRSYLLKFLRRVAYRSGIGKTPIPPAKIDGISKGMIHDSSFFGKIIVEHHDFFAFYFSRSGRQGDNTQFSIFLQEDCKVAFFLGTQVSSLLVQSRPIGLP